MSQTLKLIRRLIEKDEIRISAHGYTELVEDGILVKDVLFDVESARVVEDYPDFHKGPCVLVLQYDSSGNPIHVVWGIASNSTSPAVLVTAYRPDPEKWSRNLLKRKL